tara:strand:+ start:21878 stop:22225 length:348 start_codon:yes stop_codon:yes gene_type:complete
MIKIFGELYFIDFEELDDFLAFENKEDTIETKKIVKKIKSDGKPVSWFTTKEHIKHKEINGVKFELVRGFISDLGDEQNEVEEDIMLPNQSLEKTSIRFKLAFNTLLAYGLLKKL